MLDKLRCGYAVEEGRRDGCLADHRVGSDPGLHFE